MFVAKGEMFLSKVSLTSLENIYKTEKDVKTKSRLHCAILRKKGKAQTFISEVTGKPVTTVSDILRRFEKRGINGCYAIKQTGQPRKLSYVERKKLLRMVELNPTKSGFSFSVWTTRVVRYAIEKKFRVVYTPRQVQNIMKNFGFTLQKPRPEHVKTNKALKMRFKKNYGEKLKILNPSDMRSYFWMKRHSV